MKTDMSRCPEFASTVKERDNRQCVKCGYKPTNTTSLHAHHINPKDNGGSDDPENGATLCPTCHDFAPDWNTIISNDSYRKAFEIYRSTMNPPTMDLFYFGMMAENSEPLSVENVMQSTFFQQLPNLDVSNWWVACAGFADYKEVRSIMPMKWDWSCESSVQSEFQL